MFFQKRVEIDQLQYRLEIWDTAGQERFHSITPLYFRDAQGVIMVCDVTDKNSFRNLNMWLTQLIDQGPEDLGLCLVANKIDLIDQREVREEELEAYS